MSVWHKIKWAISSEIDIFTLISNHDNTSKTFVIRCTQPIFREYHKQFRYKLFQVGIFDCCLFFFFFFAHRSFFRFYKWHFHTIYIRTQMQSFWHKTPMPMTYSMYVRDHDATHTHTHMQRKKKSGISESRWNAINFFNLYNKHSSNVVLQKPTISLLHWLCFSFIWVTLFFLLLLLLLRTKSFRIIIRSREK